MTVSRSVGDSLVEALATAGLHVIFGVPGGQTLPLYGAARSGSLTHVLVRDERNAVYAADSLARLTGTVGVCDATLGPGVTNLVSGLAEAYAASVPVLAIVADTQRSLEHLRRRSVASQAFEQRAVLEPVTKWVARADEPETVPRVLDQALRVATTGRPGPVVLEIPEDVFDSTGEFEQPPPPVSVSYPRFRPAPDPRALAEAARHLAGARRPLIVAGGGVVLGGSAEAVATLAHELSIPVATTIAGKGTLAETDPLSAGVAGVFGNVRASAALDAADVILVLGSKLDQLSTHRWRLPHPEQTIIHADIDGEELGRTTPVTVGLLADAGETARTLLPALQGQMSHEHDWLDTLGRLTPPGTGTEDDAVAPEALVRAVSDRLAPGDIVVCDASLVSGWAAAHLQLPASGRAFVAPRGLAGIGWAAGAAIGARFAAPENARVVVLAGDGAWTYGLAEVETAARYSLDLTYIIFNNAALAWVKHGEDGLGIDPPSVFRDVDFAAVAEPMGASATRATTLAEATAQLDAALAHAGPSLMDVVTSVDASPIVSLSQLREGAYRG